MLVDGSTPATTPGSSGQPTTPKSDDELKLTFGLTVVPLVTAPAKTPIVGGPGRS